MAGNSGIKLFECAEINALPLKHIIKLINLS